MKAVLHSDPIEALRRRLGELDPRQVAIWRSMTPAQKLRFAFEAYNLALRAVRADERRLHPDLSDDELAWRVTARMQGDPKLAHYGQRGMMGGKE